MPGIRTREVKIRLTALRVHHSQGPSARIPIVENLHSEACAHGLLRIVSVYLSEVHLVSGGKYEIIKVTFVILPAGV